MTQRFAFVASGDLADGGDKPAASLTFEDLYSHAPPELSLEAGALSTRADTVKIHGSAKGTEQLYDLFGFVGGRKFFYQSNKANKDPKSATFEVVARENPDSTTRRVVVIRKDGPDGAILATPKNEESLDEAFDDGE